MIYSPAFDALPAEARAAVFSRMRRGITDQRHDRDPRRDETGLALMVLVVGDDRGGLGSGARYLVGQWAAARLGPAFPYGTLIVNLSGCFALGLVAQLASSTLVEPGAENGGRRRASSAASRPIRASTRKRWRCSRPAPPAQRC